MDFLKKLIEFILEYFRARRVKKSEEARIIVSEIRNKMNEINFEKVEEAHDAIRKTKKRQETAPKDENPFSSSW